MHAIARRLSHPTPATARGLTLIELLVALAIVMALFGVALPAVSGVVSATHAMQARSALMASYQSALTGAAAANTRSTLCPSIDGESCLPGSDWSGGWIAFLDVNADRERQPGEAIVSRQPALSRGVHLHSTRGRTRIEIQASGSVGGSNVTFTLCDGRGPAHAQALVLSNKSILRLAAASAEAVAETCAP